MRMFNGHADLLGGANVGKAAKAVQRYLRGLSSGSRRTVAQSLDVAAGAILDRVDATREDVAWHQLDRQDIEKARKQLAVSYMPATVNKMLSCVRGVLRACRDLGLMSDQQFAAASGFSNVPTVYHPEPADVRLVDDAEVKALFEGCRRDKSPAGRRDEALLVILLATGLRRAEAAALDLDDYSSARKSLRVGSDDPQKNRTIALKAKGCRLINAWVDERGGEPGPLLLPVNKSGVIAHRRLTDQAIYDIVRRLAVRADVPHITTRALRRTLVASLIARKVPLEHVQRLIGHASWVTTESYRELADELHAKADRLPQLFIDVKASRAHYLKEEES